MTAVARSSLLDRLVRLPLTAVHRLMTLGWFIRRPRTFGAHAVALTPERKLVLVKLRYARGWRLPGGGRAESEEPRRAILRELSEEIGLTSHGQVTLAAELEEKTDHKRDLASLLIVEDVRYRPKRWSWEVEQVIEVPVGRLPAGTSPRTLRWIAAIAPHL